MPLRKFIVEEKNYISVWTTIDITKWEPFTWPIKYTSLTLAININFPFRYMEFFEFCYNNDRLQYIQKQDSLSKMSPPLTYMKNKKQ